MRSILRLSFASLLLASVVGCASGPSEEGPVRIGVGDTAPDFTLIDTAGASHTLADYKGRVVVLDFWATWCTPCREISPVMQSIHESYADRPVTVLAVHLPPIKKPERYLREHNLTYPCLLDKGVAARAFDVSRIPTIMVLDADGRVVHRQLGFEKGDEATIRAAIDGALAGRS